MFDSTARLVLCNDRYLEIYGLKPEHGRAGYAAARASGLPCRGGYIHRRSGSLRRRVHAAGDGEGRSGQDYRDQGRPRHLAGQPADGARRLGRDPYRRHQPVAGREGTRLAAPARGAPQNHRCRDLGVPRPGRERAQDRRPERGGDESRPRPWCCRPRIIRCSAPRARCTARTKPRSMSRPRRPLPRSFRLDQRDQPSTRPSQRRGARRRRRSQRDQQGIAALAHVAQKIGDVVKLIQDIAGQTNLWRSTPPSRRRAPARPAAALRSWPRK